MYFTKTSISTIRSEKCVGGRGLKKADATNATTFNRELLIIEKENDGKAFALHTSYEDKETYYSSLRNPWLSVLLMFAICAILNRSPMMCVPALISLFPVTIYQTQVIKNRRKAKTKEW